MRYGKLGITESIFSNNQETNSIRSEHLILCGQKLQVFFSEHYQFQSLNILMSNFYYTFSTQFLHPINHTFFYVKQKTFLHLCYAFSFYNFCLFILFNKLYTQRSSNIKLLPKMFSHLNVEVLYAEVKYLFN